MEDIHLMETIERYLNGDMSHEEKAMFETYRNNNAHVDHKVVEQALILKKLEQLSERKGLLQVLNSTYIELVNQAQITPLTPKAQGKLITIWNKNWKTATVAACIAGFTTLFTWSLSSKINANELAPQLTQLGNKLQTIEERQKNTETLISNTTTTPGNIAKSPYGGTGFLINSRGLLATSYHIIKDKKLTGVIDFKGKEYDATLISVNEAADLALLKITDTSFKATNLPYNIAIKKCRIGDDVFTLGFPFGSLGYSKGYLSSKFGRDSDSNFVQISIPANHGQSGSPVFDNSGNVIGIICNKIEGSESVVYATQVKNLLAMVRKYNADKKVKPLVIGAGANFNSINRNDALDKIEPFIFQVKSK